MLLRLIPPWVLALVLVPSLSAQSSPAPPSVRWSGYIKARETHQDGVGLASSINRGNISWRVQGEFRTGNVGTGRATVALQDAYVRWSDGMVGVQLGQFKTPFTREFITSLTEVESPRTPIHRSWVWLGPPGD